MIQVFCDVTLCRRVSSYRRFGRSYCFHLHVRGVLGLEHLFEILVSSHHE